MGIVGVCPRWHRGEFKGYRAHWVEYIDGLPKRKTQDFYFSVYGNADLDRAILCRKLHAGT